MKVIGKDLIITDPCYIAKDADWGDVQLGRLHVTNLY